jgi:TolB-like protein/DNA-binding winged helix-turn-helix (wHTH) protein
MKSTTYTRLSKDLPRESKNLYTVTRFVWGGAMASSPASTDLVRFGEFEVNLHSRELRRRDGAAVRLPDQSFEVLTMLLERPGELVSRDEIRKRLWSADTFVDFDHGLNNAVNRLRDALGDSADTPRFVETLPRRGYRFVGAIEEAARNGGGAVAGSAAEDSPFTGPARRQVYRWIAAAAALSVLIAILVWRVQTSKHPVIHTLAVLPFQNLSGDPSQDYFADGMTDELITMLAKNRDLRVVSRTSVMRYKKIQRPLREIAAELGADGILEGSVARSGDRVHVTAQLIHAGSDTHIWAESYDHDLSDVSSLQTELAETIARQVGLSAAVSSGREKPINSGAHDAYLMGRYYWFSENFGKSREYFEKAIALQPDYAAAWSGIADSYTASAASGEIPAADALAKAEPAARKALELDDSAAEAHHAMAAVYYFLRWNWADAERESRRAMEINPRVSEIRHLRAYILQTMNRTEDALQQDREGMALDPFVRPWALALALIHARKCDEAIVEARLRSEAHPDNAFLHGILADAYLCEGMEKEAAEQLEAAHQVEGDKEGAQAVHRAFVSGGLRGVYERRLGSLMQRARKGYVGHLEFANVYALLGHKEKALEQLELSYQEREPWLVHLQDTFTFDSLHADPRYRAIINRMGLPPAY